MKKAAKLTSLFVVIVFTLFGCTSIVERQMTSVMNSALAMARAQIVDYGTYRSTVPVSEYAELRFTNVQIKAFNGATVIWGSTAFDRSRNIGKESGRIKIPSGTHSIEFSYEFYDTLDRKYYSSNRITIPPMEFKSGHVYYLVGAQLDYGLSNAIVSLGDITNSLSAMWGDVVTVAPKESNLPTELEGNWNSEWEHFIFKGNTWERIIRLDSAPAPIWTIELRINTGIINRQVLLAKSEVKTKGTFEIINDKIYLYTTGQWVETFQNSMWVDMSVFQQTDIFTYSLEDGNLILQLNDSIPKNILTRY